MTSNSEDVIFGNAAKKPKLLCSKSDEKKIDLCEVSNDLNFDKIRASMGTYNTAINNIYNLTEDYINKTNLFKQRAKSKEPDYPSDLSDDLETESFLSIHRSTRKRTRCRKSRRQAVKRTVTNKPVKVTKISDSNTKGTPQKKSVQTKNKTKRKAKPPQDVLSQPILNRLLRCSSTNGIQNSIDTNPRNHLSESIDVMQTLVSPARGVSRGLRSRVSRTRGRGQPQTTTQYPTYSIGNTEEYLDKSENIPLFSSKPKIVKEIVILDEDSDDDEEVTIHVNWQNFEVFKFNLRKSQNLRQIFDFFAKKENVTEKRLFFAYNDQILTIEDSPDSMKYNIGKFIEGGLISQELIDLVKECTSTSSKPPPPQGIQIKFQCQNFKRPYELTVQPNDKLSMAMIKCAGHFEKPLNNLKFEFDGEQIIGTATAKELDLENGDCIDIKIIK